MYERSSVHVGHPVRVVVPGDPSRATVLVRTPELRWLVLLGWLPVPLLQLAASMAPIADEQPVWIRQDEDDEARDQLERLDEWVAAAALVPRIVLDADRAGSQALHIGEVQLALKWAIWGATYEPLRQSLERAALEAERFIVDKKQVLSLDIAARRYRMRPSALIGISDPCAALDFDLAVVVASSTSVKEAPNPWP